MKKILLLITILGSCLSYIPLAQAGATAADLEQLQRLQQLGGGMQLPKTGPQPPKDGSGIVMPKWRPEDHMGIPRNAQKGPNQVLPSRRGMPGYSAPEPVDQDAVVGELAFKQMVKQLFPLTPEQIVKLRKHYNSVELSKVGTYAAPPKPVATSQFVNLSPGSTPPIIRLSKGFVTSIVFLDSSGAEWPIEAYDLGDPRTFNIQWDRSSNLIMIQALRPYNYGNIAIRLRGLNTPVMMTLIPGQKAVDYRVDMRVQGYGPNAKLPTGDVLPASVSKELLGVLDGVPPSDSRELEVMGGNAQAWIRGKQLYLRTRHQVISPGWFATLRSADGMHAYQLAKTPLVLVSQHGKILRLKIEGL